MKVGDLVEHKEEPKYWGIILAECMNQYEIYWMDGDRTWIGKWCMVKKYKKILDKFQTTGYTINITTKHWR
tara:strand:+ start:4694 stop:4906 length:213 start_codon:yes stop_codon:yes gene_type:complete